MNELLHSVTGFIDNGNVFDNQFELIAKLHLIGVKDYSDSIFQSFKNHPIEFIRLYEEMIDKSLDIDDERIMFFINELFTKEKLENAKQYADCLTKLNAKNPTQYALAPILLIFFNLLDFDDSTNETKSPD